MENVSENEPKRGRGRPRATPEWYEAAVAIAGGPGTSGHTRRSVCNAYYRTRAMGVLMRDEEPERYRWLCDMAVIKAGGDGWKATILTELGRFDDDDTLRALAERLCELRPTTREAVAMLRRARVGEPEPSGLRLMAELEGAINDYIARHPSTTWQQVEWALANLGEEIADARREAEAGEAEP